MYNVTLLFNGCGQDAYVNSDFCGQRNTEEPSKKPTEQGEKNLNIGKEMAGGFTLWPEVAILIESPTMDNTINQDDLCRNITYMDVTIGDAVDQRC